jgi:hypothetical protein
VRLQFPTARFYTDADTVTVRGTATDPAGVQSIRVNGVAATTGDGYATWRASIPVPAGSTDVVVTRRDLLGNEAAGTLASMENRGALVHRPAGVAHDTASGRLLVIDGSTDGIVAVRTSDGVAEQWLEGELPGTPLSFGYRAIAIDAANQRTVVVAATADELVAVDLASRQRSVLSTSAGSGAALSLENASCLTVDPAGQHAYVVVGWSVLRIDLASGIRTVISGGTVGGGETLTSAADVIYDGLTDPASPRLLVLNQDSTQLGVISVDLASGTRSRFSMIDAGTGPEFLVPIGMELDAGQQRLLVMDDLQGVMAVDLGMGTRTRLNVGGMTSSIGLSPGHMAFDGTSGRLYASRANGSIAAIDIDARSIQLLAASSFGTPSGTFIATDGLAIEQSSANPTSLITYSGTGGGLAKVFRFDLVTGSQTVVSGPEGPGSGLWLDTPIDMTLDRANNRALVLQGFIVADPRAMAVDLTGGDRTSLVDDSTGEFSIPWRIAYDPAEDRLLFQKILGIGPVTELHAVDLANGEFSVISDASDPGPAFSSIGQIVLEPAANPVRALMTGAGHILSVDLASGTRSILTTTDENLGLIFVDEANSWIYGSNVGAPVTLTRMSLTNDGGATVISGFDATSGELRGSGPVMHEMTRFEVDVANGVAYAASRGNVALFAVDAVSGDRVIIAR